MVKRGKKFVNLLVTDNPEARFFIEKWIKEFLAIPEKYRCNPFDVSPSGDLYWADKRNVDEIKARIKEPNENSGLKITAAEELESFLGLL